MNLAPAGLPPKSVCRPDPLPHATSTERLPVIDALRGVALLGVGWVHFLGRFAGGPLPEVILTESGSIGYPIAQGLLYVCFGKFFGLFSLLFGVSFALAARRAGEGVEGSFRTRFLLRALLLLAIGLLHQAFYRGDILIVYAVLSPLLLFARRWSNRTLLGVALVCLLGLPRLAIFGLRSEAGLFGAQVLNGAASEHLAYAELLTTGSWLEIARTNLSGGLSHKAEIYLGLLGRGYYAFGYFLLGMLFVRMNSLRRWQQNARFRADWLIGLKRGLLVAGTLSLGCFAVGGVPVNWNEWLTALAYNAYDWTNVLLTLLLAVTFVSAFKINSLFQHFASIGRMALTNYLLQTVLGVVLLYGWGLGQLQHLPAVGLPVIAVATMMLQSWMSNYWLRAFRRGPVEFICYWGLNKLDNTLRKHRSIHIDQSVS